MSSGRGSSQRRRDELDRIERAARADLDALETAKRERQAEEERARTEAAEIAYRSKSRGGELALGLFGVAVTGALVTEYKRRQVRLNKDYTDEYKKTLGNRLLALEIVLGVLALGGLAVTAAYWRDQRAAQARQRARGAKTRNPRPPLTRAEQAAQRRRAEERAAALAEVEAARARRGTGIAPVSSSSEASNSEDDFV